MLSHCREGGQCFGSSSSTPGRERNATNARCIRGFDKDPKCFERSLKLSKGKCYDAHVALGKYYFEQGDRPRALKHFLEGLEIKPLMPQVWFRVGTISMQLKDWDTALRAFTEVVQQEPEEGDAWANVADVHMHRKNPA